MSDGENDEEEGLRNTAWICRAHDAEGLAGRGVKCWVEPAVPLAAVGLQPSTVRVLVGNRALMADEGVPVSRRVLLDLTCLLTELRRGKGSAKGDNCISSAAQGGNNTYHRVPASLHDLCLSPIAHAACCALL